MDESVGIVGTGVAVQAIEAALSDGDCEFRSIELAAADNVDRLVVVGPVDSAQFERVDKNATRWLALELGGIGGRKVPEVDAAISIFGDEGGCYQCLQHRVESHSDDATTPGEGDNDNHQLATRTKRLAGAIAGSQVLDWLDGETGPGSVLELPYTPRRLFPVPGCSCGAEIDRTLDMSADSVDLDTTVDRAETTVDPRLGLVAQVGEPHSFPAPYYLAELADTRPFSDVRAGPHAAGVSADWTTAFVKAIGEALERYAAGVYRKTAFETASASDIKRPVPPAAFVRPDEGYATPDPERPIRWIPGEELSTSRGVHLPFEFVQYPPPESQHKPAITTGLGLSTDGTGALLSGLYEVIERDATMLSWYSTFEPIGLKMDSEQFDTMVRRASSEHLSVSPLLLTQDVDIPVVAVAVHREEVWPQFAIGSAADFQATSAAENALSEAIQNWMELREMGPQRAKEEDTEIGRYGDFPRVVQSFVETENTVPAETVSPTPPSTIQDELDAVLERLTAVDLDAYAVRITPRDVEMAGFEVVRVLIPEAQPLFTEERYFGKRAKSVPRELGYRPRLDRPHHPYP